MSNRERKRLLRNLDALKGFPNTATVRRLRRELKETIAALDKADSTLGELHVRPSKRQVRLESNSARASKLRKYHNYVRQIRNNYPNLSYGDIRKMFKIRKAGQQVEIPDVIWQNPSP